VRLASTNLDRTTPREALQRLARTPRDHRSRARSKRSSFSPSGRSRDRSAVASRCQQRRASRARSPDDPRYAASVRFLVVAPLLVLLACEKPREAAKVAPAVTSRKPPPQPPPPPPLPSPQPPPAVVASFLRAHAADAEPWRASFACGGTRKRLPPRDAAELARRLGENAAYIDGDYGCIGNPVDYVLARGDATLVFSEDCGHMEIGANDHAALFSPEMVSFLRQMRGD
jgi:hypothetical protein